jgi:serine/threonine protein kinase
LVDNLLTGYHNKIDHIPANYTLAPDFANVNDHKIDPLCARAYLKLSEIGKGGFSTVYLVRKKDSGKVFAMKVIDKK